MSKTNKRYLRSFLITFFLTILGCFIIIAGVGIYTFYNVAPPQIPSSVIPPTIIIDEDGEEKEVEALLAPARFTGDDRKEYFYTFLILGINSSINANTIMVASYDGVNGEANLVSIPRDTLSDSNRSIRKLNSAFNLGSQNGGVLGGVARMQQEIKPLIGFIPDFYIVVDFDGFEEIIDAVGGIEVEVPFAMRWDDPLQNLRIDLQPGVQILDGKNALHFARYRNANRGFRAITDYQRIENQQTVINATIGRLLQPANVLRIPDFIDIFNDNVYTNLTVTDMIWFTREFNEIRGTDAINTYTMPTRGTSGAPRWYEFLDPQGVLEMVNSKLNPFEFDIEMRDLNILTSE